MNCLPWKEGFEQVIKTFPDYQLDEKTLKNWAQSGKEINLMKSGSRIVINQDDLTVWKNRIENSFIFCNREDYKKCFRFAVEAYYSTMTRADFNRGKQRDVGEFLTNQIQGKLGEIAVKKMMSKHGVEIELDFTITGQIPSQDITKISTRKRIWDNPALKVSIKTTKLKNVMLAVPENEALLPDRRSNLYILSQVGLFPDHILRMLKNKKIPEIEDLDSLIPDFIDIPCRIGGWITDTDFFQTDSYYPKNKIKEAFGFEMAGANYIKVTGDLSYDWVKMNSLIIGKQVES